MISTVASLRLVLEKGSECVKVDLSAEDEDIEKLEAFAEELVAKAN